MLKPVMDTNKNPPWSLPGKILHQDFRYILAIFSIVKINTLYSKDRPPDIRYILILVCAKTLLSQVWSYFSRMVSKYCLTNAVSKVLDCSFNPFQGWLSSLERPWNRVSGFFRGPELWAPLPMTMAVRCSVVAENKDGQRNQVSPDKKRSKRKACIGKSSRLNYLRSYTWQLEL
jgi:hypothetical protein